MWAREYLPNNFYVLVKLLGCLQRKKLLFATYLIEQKSNCDNCSHSYYIWITVRDKMNQNYDATIMLYVRICCYFLHKLLCFLKLQNVRCNLIIFIRFQINIKIILSNHCLRKYISHICIIYFPLFVQRKVSLIFVLVLQCNMRIVTL